MQGLKFLNKKTILIFVVIFGLLLGVSLAYVSSDDSNYDSTRGTITGVSSGQDYDKAIEELSDRFSSSSATDAYQYFVSTYRNSDPLWVHDLAHWVGAKLYQERGAEGVRVCDQSFNFGCYHGFFGQALGMEGEEFLFEAENECYGDGTNPVHFASCTHGIGHGLLEMRGYKVEDLSSALQECDSLKKPRAPESCYNGVFMEFNTQIMRTQDGERSLGREFSLSSAMEPCNLLRDDYQKYCYYEHPAWWINHISFSRMGDLCNEIAAVESKRECYKGMGRLLLSPRNRSDDLSFREGVNTRCSELDNKSGVQLCKQEAFRLRGAVE